MCSYIDIAAEVKSPAGAHDSTLLSFVQEGEVSEPERKPGG